jgi:ATP-binding cassette subfamily B protein RaxB
MLVAIVAYADQFTSRSGALIDRLVDLGLLRLHGERISDIALAEPESATNSQYVGPEPSASVELRNVSYRYSPNDPWVIKNTSLFIDAGESIAISGPSGCGKTTLAKIILGLLVPEEGEVLVGGVSIRSLGLDRYRRMCGAVMQEDTLFAGSIAENISFFESDSALDDVIESARLAQIDDDITAMPMAYESFVGDMGSSLSGGQKQRILLARAIHRRPKILLLDEATSHLDSAREVLINESIKRMKMTRIIIAHRETTLASADSLYSMG